MHCEGGVVGLVARGYWPADLRNLPARGGGGGEPPRAGLDASLLPSPSFMEDEPACVCKKLQ